MSVLEGRVSNSLRTLPRKCGYDGQEEAGAHSDALSYISGYNVTRRGGAGNKAENAASIGRLRHFLRAPCPIYHYSLTTES
jgi:hypothetical protein